MVSAFVDGSGALGVAILFPLLCSIAVGGRFFVRRSRKISLGWDDWSILFATCVLWIQCIIIIVGVAMQAFGVHTNINPATGQVQLTPQTFLNIKLTVGFYLCFPVSLGAVKLSVLLFFRRLFVGNVFRIWSLGLCVFIALWSISWWLSELLQCGSHVSAFWSGPVLIKQYCDNAKNQWLVITVFDVLTDVLVLVTPLPLLRKLQIKFAQKAALFGIFLLGVLSTAVAITRLIWVVVGPFDSKFGSRDLAAINTLNVVWAQIEVGVAIFAACLPTLRPLFMGSSPESLLGSIRSVMSLRSFGAKSSKVDTSKVGWDAGKSVSSDRSRSVVECTSHEHDVESGPTQVEESEQQKKQDEQIWMQKEVVLTEEHTK